jgi:hypothetical protein
MLLPDLELHLSLGERGWLAKAPRRKGLPPGHDNILWLDRIESDQTLVERLQLNSCLLCALATLRAIKRPEFLDSVIEEISNQNVRTVLPDLELHLSLGERGWLAKPPRRKGLPPGHDNILWLDRIGSYQTFVERSQLTSCLLCAFATLRAKNLRMI